MRLNLFVRMTAPVVLLSVLLLVLGIGSSWYVVWLEQDTATVFASNVTSIRAAEELTLALRELRTRINQFLLTRNRSNLESIDELRLESDRWLAEAERLGKTPRETELMHAVREGYEAFVQQHERTLRAGTEAESLNLAEAAQQVLTQSVLSPAQKYLDYNERAIEETSARTQLVARRMAFGLLLLGTCGPLAGLLMGLAMAHRLTRSIVQLNVPVHDAAGKLNEVVGPITISTGSDLHALDEALRGLAVKVSTVVEQLHQSRQAVLRTDQLAALGQLAAGVAHELRNPLQSMQLLVQSAVEEGDTGCLEGQDLIVLQEALARAKRSLQTFLDFARPPVLEKRIVNLNQIVQQTLDLVRGRARRQGVVLRFTPPTSEIRVPADADQLRQLVLNLLLNALDAINGAGSVGVELHETRLAGGGPSTGHVVLEVWDTGVGIPEGIRSRIFEPFVTSKETGVGLGLAICKRIVDAHDGSLTTCDRSEGGTCFRAVLPVAA
ncbi:MAG: ATP-binding protein [Pirellulaceae bacterium]